MYLINSATYELREFIAEPPPYAILSHTWGKEEVLFETMQSGKYEHLGGFQKIKQSCTLARRQDLDYVWVDTCCIDKKSSAELSEAINSMYQYYEEAVVCFAFLSDIEPGTKLGESRWFRRGWTLQELLAPRNLTFYDRHWARMGSRGDFQSDISKVTGIQAQHMSKPRAANAAQKLSWLARRETTRKEDIAYCMFGLFNVNMPLLYGEGTKAFRRLQEEVLRTSNDQSQFAWHAEFQRGGTSRRVTGMLAPSPLDFLRCGEIVESTDYMRLIHDDLDYVDHVTKQTSMTNMGVSIHVNYFKISALRDLQHDLWIGMNAPRREKIGNPMIGAILSCADSKSEHVVIWLAEVDRNLYARIGTGWRATISDEVVKQLQIRPKRIIVMNKDFHAAPIRLPESVKSPKHDDDDGQQSPFPPITLLTARSLAANGYCLSAKTKVLEGVQIIDKSNDKGDAFRIDLMPGYSRYFEFLVHDDVTDHKNLSFNFDVEYGELGIWSDDGQFKLSLEEEKDDDPRFGQNHTHERTSAVVELAELTYVWFFLSRERRQGYVHLHEGEGWGRRFAWYIEIDVRPYSQEAYTRE